MSAQTQRPVGNISCHAAAVANPCGHLAALQRSLHSDAASRTRRVGTRSMTRPTPAGPRFFAFAPSFASAHCRRNSRFSGMLRLLSAERPAAQCSSNWRVPRSSLLNPMARVLACAGRRFHPPWPACATERGDASTCKELWIFESSAPRQAQQIVLTAVVR